LLERKYLELCRWLPHKGTIHCQTKWNRFANSSNKILLCERSLY